MQFQDYQTLQKAGRENELQQHGQQSTIILHQMKHESDSQEHKCCFVCEINTHWLFPTLINR